MARQLFLLLLPAILGFLVSPPPAAAYSNYMLSGETLKIGDRLVSGNLQFIMQGDCNLVLYGGNWQSNTANNGRDCELTLTDYGELTIRSSSGSLVWSSKTKSVKGKYAAVVHPEGSVIVYGPSIWTINPWVPHLNRSQHLGNTPEISNILFSGQVLYDDGRLTAEGMELVMQGDCNLVLYGGNYGWQSNTHGNGKYCFLRLDHKGELFVKDDGFRTVWKSGVRSTEGDYAFILQNDGYAIVYGPRVWQTNASGKAEKMTLSMVTVN